jgi:hypothetical protein
MLTNDLLRQLLDEFPDRETRSSLEPYRALVIEMRRRKYSYREIARLLTERCGLDISHSAVHDFVKRRCHAPPTSNAGNQRPPSLSTAPFQFGENRGDSEEPQVLRERIAAIKRRPRIAATTETGFRFDAAQPLRLEDEET